MKTKLHSSSNRVCDFARFNILTFLMFLTVSSAFPPSARAGELFFTNSLGGNFLTAANWSPNGVPGAADNAHFTSNATYQVTWSASRTNANAFFGATSGTVTQAIGALGSFTWLLTNSYIVGQNAGALASVTHSNGTLLVTNSAGTAVLDVRRGTNRFNAGIIETDRLLLTNTAGKFEFNGGTLITRTATISNGQDFVVGPNAGFGATTWDVRSNATPTVLANGLDLGSNATNATLRITNGATLSVGLAADGTTSARLGVNGGSTNNLAIVAGPNSLWTNGGNLFVGYSGSFNTLLITNGGRVANSVTRIGFNSTADNNQVVVAGAGSLWTHSADLRVGAAGSFNTLLITNGGQVANTLSRIGFTAGAISNQVTVTGAGSLWTNSADLRVGQSGSFNTLLITNGGRVANSLGSIGEISDSSTNQVIVTGAGSVWANSSDLRVGVSGSFHSLLITNGGAVQAANAYVGLFASSSNNLLNVRNGTLTVTNATQNGALDIRRGTNQLNSGLVEADLLLVTNTLGYFEFNGGTFNVRTSTVANGQTFFVGNGVSQAEFILVGDGAHSFADGLTLRSNASLFGSGRISGTLSVSNGATLFPQSLVLSNSPGLAGLVFINLFMSGGFKTNYHVEVTGPLAYGGRLIIDPEALGSNPLALGDRFQLFTASSYAGAFSIITLPSLGFGLAWSNNLLLDGSIEVVATPPADRFWTNALGGTYSIDQNWLGNLGPGPQDDANFTNNASYLVNWTSDAAAANAFFNANSGTVTQSIGAFSWLLTNSYVIGQNAGSTATVTHASGTLRVTNAAGNAVFDVRRGTNRLNAGVIDVDQLVVTNIEIMEVFPGTGIFVTNETGAFVFNGGTLITRGGLITNGLPFNVGESGSTPAIWDARAGRSSVLPAPLAGPISSVRRTPATMSYSSLAQGRSGATTPS